MFVIYNTVKSKKFDFKGKHVCSINPVKYTKQCVVLMLKIIINTKQKKKTNQF